jgi:hypothetical protein
VATPGGSMLPGEEGMMMLTEVRVGLVFYLFIYFIILNIQSTVGLVLVGWCLSMSFFLFPWVFNLNVHGTVCFVVFCVVGACRSTDPHSDQR